MAPTGTKFCLPTWRMFAVSCAVFILLSEVLASSEQRQCYWCGPLAEQIHRSRRAPACDAPGENVTTCDPGHGHCAMVATSPPYVESRYCVKFYQDECYSLYCSSTKTWRMTCPCRGDFCNGDKTERESNAFASLAKLVTNTHNNRIKKRTIITSSSLEESDEMQAATLDMEQNITQADNSTYGDETNTKQTDEQNVVIENMTPKSDNINEHMEINKSYNNVEINIIENDTNELTTLKSSEEHIIIITTQAVQEIELPGKTTDAIINEETIVNNSVNVNERSTTELRQENIGNDDIVDNSVNTNERATTELRQENIGNDGIVDNSVNTNERATTELHQENIGKDGMLNDAEYKAETSPTYTEVTPPGKPIDDNLVKPSEILPTAEALQQNANPPATTEKPQTMPEHTSQTTVMTTQADSTVMSTLKNDETVKPKLTKMKENGALRNIVNSYTIIVYIFFLCFK